MAPESVHTKAQTMELLTNFSTNIHNTLLSNKNIQTTQFLKSLLELSSLQCFDSVGWAAERASDL